MNNNRGKQTTEIVKGSKILIKERDWGVDQKPIMKSGLNGKNYYSFPLIIRKEEDLDFIDDDSSSYDDQPYEIIYLIFWEDFCKDFNRIGELKLEFVKSLKSIEAEGWVNVIGDRKRKVMKVERIKMKDEEEEDNIFV